MFASKKRQQAVAAAAQEKMELEAKVAAINRSQAVIEFKLDGTILAANQNFLLVLGYSADEIVSDSPELSKPSRFAGSTGKSRVGRRSSPVRSRIV